MTQVSPYYLDNASTTRLHPRVLEAMLPWMRGEAANPSSIHRFGREARVAVERARESVAALICAHPSEIVFTSGGTESNNTAIHFALAGTEQNAHVLTSPAEHQAVLQPLANRRHSVVSMLPVDRGAVPSPDDTERALRSDTVLIALMHANNETGGLLDVAAVSDVLHGYTGLLFCDMVQSAGKVPLRIHDTRIDLASLSAHKLHGPQGIGALYMRRGLDFRPMILGGAQERARRGGTEAVAAIVGFGEAARLALEERETRYATWVRLREQLLRRLRDGVPGIVENVSVRTLPNIVSVTLPYAHYPIDGGMLLVDLDLRGCAVSAGSACTAGSIEPSHVMRAIGHDEHSARSSVRFSFGAFTEAETVERGAEVFVRSVQDMVERSSSRSHSRKAIP
ncbi:MAG: cysteine desulfurase [Bacteroidia bacterium]|nr:cysteine desulfurase [Bacteroidia bacterium]